MSSVVDFTKKCLVVITGASRGIGQTIAVEVSRRLSNDSKIILIARSEKALGVTKQLIHGINNKILVNTYVLDLSKPDIKDYEPLFEEVKYDVSIIFHNAGQAGTLDFATELSDLETWRNYFDLNLFSVTLLNSVFLKKTKGNCKEQFVINISSLCGHKPFINMALYGSAKAARDLFFSVLAEEERNVIVLKYCPGPVDTQMFNEVIQNAQSNELKNQFKDMKETVLTTDQTVQKLLKILEGGQYKSGDLIDYYDV